LNSKGQRCQGRWRRRPSARWHRQNSRSWRVGKWRTWHLMNVVPLDKLLLLHFCCDKIEKMKVLKQSWKGQLNRAKSSTQAVQQPPQHKGRVNSFTKTNMALQLPTLTMQRNRCESGALFHAEKLNR
jgi:hypothetical protein